MSSCYTLAIFGSSYSFHDSPYPIYDSQAADGQAWLYHSFLSSRASNFLHAVIETSALNFSMMPVWTSSMPLALGIHVKLVRTGLQHWGFRFYELQHKQMLQKLCGHFWKSLVSRKNFVGSLWGFEKAPPRELVRNRLGRKGPQNPCRGMCEGKQSWKDPFVQELQLMQASVTSGTFCALRWAFSSSLRCSRVVRTRFASFGEASRSSEMKAEADMAVQRNSRASVPWRASSMELCACTWFTNPGTFSIIPGLVEYKYCKRRHALGVVKLCGIVWFCSELYKNQLATKGLATQTLWWFYKKNCSWMKSILCDMATICSCAHAIVDNMGFYVASQFISLHVFPTLCFHTVCTIFF